MTDKIYFLSKSIPTLDEYLRSQIKYIINNDLVEIYNKKKYVKYIDKYNLTDRLKRFYNNDQMMNNIIAAIIFKYHITYEIEGLSDSEGGGTSRIIYKCTPENIVKIQLAEESEILNAAKVFDKFLLMFGDNVKYLIDKLTQVGKQEKGTASTGDGVEGFIMSLIETSLGLGATFISGGMGGDVPLKLVLLLKKVYEVLEKIMEFVKFFTEGGALRILYDITRITFNGGFPGVECWVEKMLNVYARQSIAYQVLCKKIKEFLALLSSFIGKLFASIAPDAPTDPVGYGFKTWVMHVLNNLPQIAYDKLKNIYHTGFTIGGMIPGGMALKAIPGINTKKKYFLSTYYKNALEDEVLLEKAIINIFRNLKKSLLTCKKNPQVCITKIIKTLEKQFSFIPGIGAMGMMGSMGVGAVGTVGSIGVGAFGRLGSLASHIKHGGASDDSDLDDRVREFIKYMDMEIAMEQGITIDNNINIEMQGGADDIILDHIVEFTPHMNMDLNYDENIIDEMLSILIGGADDDDNDHEKKLKRIASQSFYAKIKSGGIIGIKNFYKQLSHGLNSKSNNADIDAFFLKQERKAKGMAKFIHRVMGVFCGSFYFITTCSHAKSKTVHKMKQEEHHNMVAHKENSTNHDTETHKTLNLSHAKNIQKGNTQTHKTIIQRHNKSKPKGHT